MKRSPSRIRGGQGCSMMNVCDIPIGKDDTGGPLYGFCIGNGYTGEK